MPTVLKLNQLGVRQAMRHDALKGLPRIARGAFCAVFDRGDTVLKLTADPVQYSFATDHCAPRGKHFTTLVKNYGCVGSTADDEDLFLFEVEKLQPVRRGAPVWVKKLVDRLIDSSNRQQKSHLQGQRGSSTYREMAASALAMNDLALDMELPMSLRDSLDQLSVFIRNYRAVQDFHKGNIMLRGDTIVLNDVVADAAAVERMWARYHE